MSLTEYRAGTGVAQVERSNGERRLEGLGIPLDQWSEDLGGFRERILPRAFEESIGSGDIRCVFNHNKDRVIGRRSAGTVEVWENASGVHYRAQPPATVWANDMLVSIERGDIRENSFAMEVKEDQWDQGADVLQRTVTKARLLELGPQTFPAYGQSSVQVRCVREAYERGCAAVSGSAGSPDLTERRLELQRTEKQLRKLLPQVRATAHHESGHAVAYRLAGAGVYRVSVDVDGTGECLARDTSRREGWCSVAGYVAEQLGGFDPDPFVSGCLFAGDRENLYRALYREGVRDNGEEAWRTATKQLRSNWAAVQALAELLIQRGEVDGAEAEKVIDMHIGVN